MQEETRDPPLIRLLLILMSYHYIRTHVASGVPCWRYCNVHAGVRLTLLSQRTRALYVHCQPYHNVLIRCVSQHHHSVDAVISATRYPSSHVCRIFYRSSLPHHARLNLLWGRKRTGLLFRLAGGGAELLSIGALHCFALIVSVHLVPFWPTINVYIRFFRGLANLVKSTESPPNPPHLKWKGETVYMTSTTRIGSSCGVGSQSSADVTVDYQSHFWCWNWQI